MFCTLSRGQYGRLYFHGAKAGHKIDDLRPVIMKLEATDEESKIACEQQ